MARRSRRVSKKVGLSPGTLVYTGDRESEKTVINITEYRADHLSERADVSQDDVFRLKPERPVTWIDVEGLHDVDFIDRVGKHFKIHSLVLEDIVNVGQRPKIEDHGDYLFATLKFFTRDGENGDLRTGQISLLLFPNTVLSFREQPGGHFDVVRERIRGGRGRIRNMGTDYLAYALIDAVVDMYFQLLEGYSEKLETLEETLLADPRPETLALIHRYRREIITIRKSVWPIREMISGMERGGSRLLSGAILPFLRDLYDHSIQISETLDSMRELISGMRDTYLSSVSNRMNEVMKVLTLIATLFIPLTFIAGVYGMNFEHMPELKWDWIYPNGFWITIGVISLGMALFFRKKKWF